MSDLQSKGTNVGDEEASHGIILDDAIRDKLEYLVHDFSKLEKGQTVDLGYTISDLYVSLCVLRNQVWMPIAVLRCMWQQSEKFTSEVVRLLCAQGLASLSFRRTSDGTVEAGVTLDDLNLQFCKRQAISENSEHLWHSSLLNGLLGAPSDSELSDPCTQSAHELVSAARRPWWEIPEDGYTHANLARHLVFSRRGAELAALLLDARWTNMRCKIGGVAGIKADFEILDKLLELGGGRDSDNNRLKGIRKSFQVIFKAIQLSWAHFSIGQKPFQFQVCGRLLSLRKDDLIIDAAIRSFEVHTPKPYLMPMSRFFPGLNSTPTLEIPTEGDCFCVAHSPCGRYVAASGSNITIGDAITGHILQRLKGHRHTVRWIRFAAGSKRIISASQDKTIAIWEWEKSDKPIHVLSGHTGHVMSLDVSRDGDSIVSGSSDHTVRLWDGLTGGKIDVFAQDKEVMCVAFCSEDGKVAVGMQDGALKVIDMRTRRTFFEDRAAHSRNVMSVAWNSNTRRLATGSYDKSIRIWDTEKWTAIGSPVAGHAGSVEGIDFSPDERQLVSCSADNTIRLWNVAPPEEIGASSHRPVLSELYCFYSEEVWCVSFTCDGARIVSGWSCGTIRIQDVPLERTQGSFGHNGSVHGISISPDGQRVATGSWDKTVLLWDTKARAQNGIALKGHTGSVTCVSFNTNGRLLVSGSADSTLRIWDTMNFKEIGAPFEGHSGAVRCVSFSFDGRRIISGGDDKTVRLWNVETHRQVGGPLIGHVRSVKHVSESSDGHVVSRDWNGRYGHQGVVIIWNRNSHAIDWTSWRSDVRSRITMTEAESIIYSCGHMSPMFSADCAADIFCTAYNVYSAFRGAKVLQGQLPSYAVVWKYDDVAKVFAAGLDCGSVAICKLVE